MMTPATKAQIPVIGEIYNMAAEYAGRDGRRTSWPTPFPIDILRNYVAAGELYVFGESSAQPVQGVARVTEQVPETIWPDANDAMLHVSKVAITEKVRGTRFFERIVLQGLEGAVKERRMDGIRMECLAANPRLRALYEDLGFMPDGEANIASPLTGNPITLARYTLNLRQLACV